MYGAGDVRVETVPDPGLIEPTDAVVRVTRSAICGSDLWPYNQMEHTDTGRRMGHEFIGVVEDVGAEVQHGEGRRPRRHTVRVVGRNLRVLPRGASHIVPPRRPVRDGRRRRRPGRGRSRSAGGRHVGRAAGGTGRRADAVAARALGRHGDGPLRRALRPGRPREDGGRRRRRRRRAVRSDCRTAPRRGANHHPRPACRPDRAGGGVRGDGRRERARRRGGRARPRAHRRPGSAFGSRVRRARPVDRSRLSRSHVAGGAVGRVGVPAGGFDSARASRRSSRT